MLRAGHGEQAHVRARAHHEAVWVRAACCGRVGMLGAAFRLLLPGAPKVMPLATQHPRALMHWL